MGVKCEISGYFGSGQTWTIPHADPIESPQRSSQSNTQYYMLNDERTIEKQSYQVGGMVAGDTNDDSRYAEWQHVNGAIVPTRIQIGVPSELFSAYNITLDADRASSAATNYALQLGATDLEYEVTRVKSPVLGRDMNPMGRGDGTYYANGGNVGGSVAITGAKPAFLGNIGTGFGTSVNNPVCTGACGPGPGDLSGHSPPPYEMDPICRMPHICYACCLPSWEQTTGVPPSCCPENCDFENGYWPPECCAEAFDLAECDYWPCTNCMARYYGLPLPHNLCVGKGMECWDICTDWLKRCMCLGENDGGCVVLGTRSCEYYDRHCKDPGINLACRWYYCNVAPNWCRAFGDSAWARCARYCLQRCDQAECHQWCYREASGPRFLHCVSTWCHSKCYPRCAYDVYVRKCEVKDVEVIY